MFRFGLALNRQRHITPPVTPTITITASAASVNEGDFFVLTIETTNYAGSTVNFTVAGAGITLEDTDWETEGYFDLVDGSAEIEVGITADETTEGSETMTITVTIPDTGISDSVEIVINDTSVTPPAPTQIFYDTYDETGSLPMAITAHTPNVGNAATYITGSGLQANIAITGELTFTVGLERRLAMSPGVADGIFAMTYQYFGIDGISWAQYAPAIIIRRNTSDGSQLICKATVQGSGGSRLALLSKPTDTGIETLLGMTAPWGTWDVSKVYRLEVTANGNLVEIELFEEGVSKAYLATNTTFNQTQTGHGMQHREQYYAAPKVYAYEVIDL